jgi:hypothetical protein
MLVAEFPAFEALLKKHSEVFGKKLTDEMVQGYWAAVKDLSLQTITRCADNHMRFSKFFPKPVELRPKDEAPTSVKEDKDFKSAVERNIANWDERLGFDPEARSLLEAAYCARLLLRYPRGSWEHAEARKGNYRWALST